MVKNDGDAMGKRSERPLLWDICGAQRISRRLAVESGTWLVSLLLTVGCQPCGRRGRYNVGRLVAKHGNAKILYVLAKLTNCPKVQSTDIYDRCKARYEGLSTR